MFKASDILDEMELGDATSSLAVGYAAFTICPECGHVDSEHQTLMNQPCVQCGINVEVRRVLFWGDEQRILEMIFDCYRSAHSKELCVLLFCTLIEHHLRNLVIARCRRVGIPSLVIKLLLDKYSRVDDRLKLFEWLTGSSIKTTVAGLIGQNVFKKHSKLRAKRNSLAHGLPAAPYTVTPEDIRDAVDESANSFSTFAHLHHTSCAIDSPPLPTD